MSRRPFILAPALFAACICRAALAQPARIDLGEYQLAATITLPSFVDEASSVAYDPESGNLFIIGDAGRGIGEFTRAGTYLGAMTFSGFEDPEGITFVGSGRFAVSEGRLQNLYLLTYVRSGVAARASLQSASLGEATGNSGIEGVSFEPISGLYFAVKEKTPQRVIRAQLNFPAGQADTSDLFSPASLGLLDLADLTVLSTVPSLIGTPDQNNLLIISQESARIVKASRTGTVLGTLSLAGLSTSAEGVAIDERGVIFVVDETPRLFIFQRRCPADFNHDGVRDVPDIFSFLAAWFSGHPAANFDGLGPADSTDIFAFLSAWFSGCP